MSMLGGGRTSGSECFRVCLSLVLIIRTFFIPPSPHFSRAHFHSFNFLIIVLFEAFIYAMQKKTNEEFMLLAATMRRE